MVFIVTKQVFKLFSSTKIDKCDILMLRERNLLDEYNGNTIVFNMIILFSKIVQKIITMLFLF